MSVTATMRRAAFHGTDRLRGGTLTRSVADVEAGMAAPRSPAVTELRRARVARILGWASRTTDFYAGRDAELAAFPVVDKRTFRSHRDAMLSRSIAPEERIALHTSGSTGTPFEALWDKGKQHRNTADTLAFLARAGYRLGMPMYYLRAWHGQYARSRLRARMQAVVRVEVLRLDGDAARDVLARIARSRTPVALLGYPSGIEALCRALDDGADRAATAEVAAKVATVIGSGEAPTEYLYEAVPRLFGRPLVGRYSNTENGILAQQRPGSRGYHLNVASYAVEILRPESDEPAGPGETGRIVVTDLFNRALPFIRYDTGDVGAFAVDAEGNVDPTTLATVAGRTFDQILDTHDVPLNPMSVDENMEQFGDVDQYQLIQTASGCYVIRLNAPVDPARDERMRADLRGKLGQDADIELTYVDEVPLLGSGKRRIIVNEWLQGRR